MFCKIRQYPIFTVNFKYNLGSLFMMKIGIIGCGYIGSVIAENFKDEVLACYDRNMENMEKISKIVNRDINCSFEKIIKMDLADSQLLSKLKKLASGNNCKIYIPHGAIGGLDAVKTASLLGITKIVLTTRKNPEVLGIKIIKEKIVFEGHASEAVKKFPKNINVSAALSLAADKEAYVRIIADPSVDTNIHEIYVEGSFGKMNFYTCCIFRCESNKKLKV